ncbi:MAG: hypothetical protein ACREDJ_05795 [Methylocella sp.]
MPFWLPAGHPARNAPVRRNGAAIKARQGGNRRGESRFDHRASVSFRVFPLFLTGKALTGKTWPPPRSAIFAATRFLPEDRVPGLVLQAGPLQES